MSVFNRWSSGNKNRIPPPKSRSFVVTADPIVYPTTRAPIFTPIAKPPIGQTFVAVNLLLTTLATVAAQGAPFRQTDWPNPSRPAQVRQADPQPNLLLSTLAQPFRQTEWPNPPKLRPPPQPEIPQNLLGLDASKGVPFDQSDWPNPQRPQAPPQWSAPYFRQYDPCPAGPYYGTAAVNDAVEGDVAWSTPGNAVGSDDAYASCVLVAQTSQRLNVTGFGFKIAPTKIIVGIVVETEAKQLLGGGSQRIRLLKAGALQTPSKFSVWDTTEGFFSVGAPTDRWSNTWTPADINDPNFGVSIRNSAGTTDTLSVDSVRVTVYCADFPFSQTDWPNPRPCRPQQPADPPNLLTTTLGGTVQAPFFQTDWPVASKRAVIQPDAPQNLLALDPSKGIPFAQKDWPLPPKPKPVAQPDIPQSLITLDRATNPFKQLDWPNPSVRKSQQPADPLNVTINLPIVVQPPFFQTEWPNPIGRPALRLENPPNLTISLPIAPPIVPIDWPNPAPRRAQRVDDSPNLLTNTLAPAVGQAPFKQLEWPNPKPAPLIFHELNVLRIFPNPFAQYDWPNPPPRKTVRIDYPPNITILLPAPVQPPFFQTDWPLPARRVSQQPEIPQSLITLDRATNPFSQKDWPNPAVRKSQQPADPLNLTIRLPVAPPFNQLDWPSARVTVRAQQPDPPNLLLSTLFVAPAALPYNQYDWPNQRTRAKYFSTEIPPNLLTSTLFVAPAPSTVRKIQRRHWSRRWGS